MTRTRKELIELAPLWAVGMLLCLAPLFLRPSDDVESVLLAVYAIGCTLLAVAIFGREVAGGTLALLLVQPISRARLLLEKSAPAVVASSALGFLWGLLCLGRGGWEDERWFILVCMVLVPVCCLGPGVFLTLWLRQASGAFWISLLMPAFLLTLLEIVCRALGVSTATRPTVAVLALSVYGGTGGWLAWLYFRSLQDLEPKALSWSYPVGRARGDRVVQTRRAVRALVGKELRLQTINLGLVTLLFLSYLLGATVEGLFVEGKAVILFLWFLLPFSIGAIPIAWEQRLGISEWQAVQPISRFVQWLTKISVVWVLSLLAGVIFWAVPGEHEKAFFILRNANSIEFFAIVFGWFLLAPLVGLVASSFTSSYLVTLSLAAAMGGAFWALLLGGVQLLGFLPPVPPNALLGLVGFVSALPVLYWIASRNYHAILIDRGRTLASLAAGLVMVTGWFTSSYLAYHRPWQWWFEPAPGPSIAVEGVTPVVRPALGAIAPDGGLWVRYDLALFRPVDRVPGVWSGLWWLHFKGPPRGLCLRADGTLWVVDAPWSQVDQPVAPVPEPRPLFIGHEWTKIAHFSNSGLGLKADGSLWQWTLHAAVDLEQIEPQEVKTVPNWNDIGFAGGLAVAIDADGSCWAWRGASPHEQVPVTPTRVASEHRWRRFEEGYLENAAGDRFGLAFRLDGQLLFASAGNRYRWQAIASGNNRTVAIRDDGTLWDRIWTRYPQDSLAEEEFRRVSDRSDWVEVAGSGERFYGMTADGSLWAIGDAVMRQRRFLPSQRAPHVIAQLR